ncbi:MAG: hypothetical protein HYR88_16640 [Verrucomicrobia bacterium]|nr:hypothetical protein [Verrucomicrobiota bacterium]MBI3870330.1 hypothetical protein [Verrucomicrobiota bacterium]
MRFHRLSISTPVRDARLSPSASPAAAEAAARQREALAREEGRKAAEKELREQIIEQRAQLAALQHGVLKSLQGAVTQVVLQSEALLVDLAMELATKLVSSMPIAPELVAANVKEALAQVEEAAEVTVQIHPEDAALMEQIGWEQAQDGHGLRSIRIVKDSRIERGGCVVQTAFGVVDNQRSTKVRQLQEAIAS